MSKLTKLDPDAALGEGFVTAETVIAGEPNDGYTSFAKVGNLDIGLWGSGPYEERIDCPVDEVMFVISGSATLTADDGEVTEIQAGDAVYMAKGWKGVWKQTEAIRKFCVILESQPPSERDL